MVELLNRGEPDAREFFIWRKWAGSLFHRRL